MKEAGLDVLNCGLGHLELRFSEQDVIEVERAKRIIQDMLKRGYSLFITGKDGALTRVKKFIPATGTYIIADGPTVAPTPIRPQLAAPPEAIDVKPVPKQRGRPRKATTKVAMTKAKAIVIGRSAGG